MADVADESTYDAAPAEVWNTLHVGDNLDVLPLLAPGSVDVVYTDPPYNTGNDFAYADRFRDGSHADPYAGRHAAWTAMMRPRNRVQTIITGHRRTAPGGRDRCSWRCRCA